MINPRNLNLQSAICRSNCYHVSTLPRTEQSRAWLFLKSVFSDLRAIRDHATASFLTRSIDLKTASLSQRPDRGHFFQGASLRVTCIGVFACWLSNKVEATPTRMFGVVRPNVSQPFGVANLPNPPGMRLPVHNWTYHNNASIGNIQVRPRMHNASQNVAHRFNCPFIYSQNERSTK